MPYPDVQRRLTSLLKIFGVAVLYALFAHLSHLYVMSNGSGISAVWSSSGLTLAAILIGGKRYAWSAFIGSLLMANVMEAGALLWVNFAIASGNALAALFGAWLLTRNNKAEPGVDTLRDFLQLIFLGGCAASMVSALVGNTALLASGFIGSGAYLHNLLRWWMGDVLGVILIATLILSWRKTKNMHKASAAGALEAALLFGLTFLLGQVVFLDWFHESVGFVAKGYWVFLFITWIAVRIGVRGVTVALLMIAIQALLGAYYEVGFFEHDIAQTQLANFWFYMATLSVVGMALASYFTEHKQTEEKLAQSLALLQTVIDTSPMRIFWKDRESRYLGCNTAFAKDAGEVCPDDLAGKDDYQLGWKAQAGLYRADDRQVMESGIPKIAYDEPQTTSDGHQVWLRTSKVPLRDHANEVIGVLGIYEDTTERKLEREALNQFKYTLDQTLDSIFMFDASDFRFIYVNEGAVKQVGYTYDELMGMTPLDIKPEFTLERFLEMVQPLCDGAKPSLNFETVHRHKDGHDIPVEIFLQLVRKEGAEPRFMAVVRDITLRRSNEAKIERLSRTYRLLSRVNEAIVRTRGRDELFSAICGAAMESGLFRFVWIGMLDEQKLAVIPVAYAGLEEGYLSGKLNILLDDERTGNGPSGRAIRDGTHAVCQDIEHDSSMAPWRDEALKRGYRASAAFSIRETGGEAGAINVYASETHFFTPDIIQLMLELAADVSFSLDVFAERKRRELAEDEIRQMNVELERRVAERTYQLEAVNRELEAFCYSVSHDLRTPLRSIDGFSQILLKKHQGQLDATGMDYLERVRRASQRMGHLIDDMLQLSQVTRGELKREQIDLSKIAQEVAEGLHKAHPERTVGFALQKDLTVHADRGLLRIVMDNLLGNAWKYTGKKAEAEIEFGVSDIDGERTFFVRDNGAGFNMEYAHKLFGAFQRLHGANEFEGTGIGLATVQRVIHRHHGKVWAEANEGQGATFYFTLPQRERGGAC